MGTKQRLLMCAGFAVIMMGIYLFFDLGPHWEYVLPRRFQKILAIVLTGSTIAFSTVVFQTVTHNRILTPSIIGMDSLYILLQTVVVFIFGSTSTVWVNANVHFFLSTGLMIVFAGLLYRMLFKQQKFNIYFILLVGMVCGVFFQSLSSFLQMMIDPNEFLVVQSRMFASFNNVQTNILVLAIGMTGVASLFIRPYIKYLDVLALGRDHALNLGLDYDRLVQRLWFAIVVFVSISTALVGPIAFFGLLIANLAYQFFKTYRHTVLITGAILLSIATLVGAVLIVERVFSFSTTVSVIVNFCGSIYFLYLVLKESQA